MREINIAKGFNSSLLRDGGEFSFINLASLSSYFSCPAYDRIKYFCDGMLMSGLVSLLIGEPVNRVSFDYTSIADDVFKYAEKNSKKICVIGANTEQMTSFSFKITSKYPQLVDPIFFDGYFDNEKLKEIIKKIRDSEVDIVVLSLGAGRQEDVLLKIREHCLSPCIFTSGGFVRQESESRNDYYPYWIDRMNVRFIYRMLKEPHTIKRYLFLYPYNFVKLIYLIKTKKMKVVCK